MPTTYRKLLYSHFQDLSFKISSGVLSRLSKIFWFFLCVFCFFLFLFPVFFNRAGKLYLLHFVEEGTFYVKLILLILLFLIAKKKIG